MIACKVLFVFAAILVYGCSLGEEVCYPKYGCFSDEPPFDDFFVDLPQDPQIINTEFFLFTPRTRSTRGQRIIMDDLNAIHNGLDSNLKLTVIIHGFLQNGRVPWVRKMRRELMQRDKMNVIAVDWKQGSSALNSYHSAAGNTRLVGAQVAVLIQKLHQRFNYNLSKIHVIGHSLGAHVAGFAGAKVQAVLAGKKLGRISGLDPAGPSFDHNDINKRLDPSDAKFVDVIHTNIGGLGLGRACGHVDFYPNGGKDQPDFSPLGVVLSSICALTISPYSPQDICTVCKMKNLFPYIPQVVCDVCAWKGKFSISPQDICDHMKVLTMFTATINNKCSRKAIPCTNWQAFKQRSCSKCTGACAEMGYDADQHHRGGISTALHKLYLKTLNSYPYCSPHYYKVTLHNLRVSSSFWSTDQIKIKLHGQSRDSITTRPRDVKSGTVSHVIVSNVKLDPLRHVSISYKGSSTSSTMYIGKVTVTGPQFKYRADYNGRISTGKKTTRAVFFNIDTPAYKTYKKPLHKIN